MSGGQHLHRVLTREASSRSAALLRIAVAAIALTRLAFALLPSHGHEPARIALGLVFYLSTLAMFVGFKSRVAASVSGISQLGAYYVLGKEMDLPGFASHHTYLLAVVTLLVALMPCERSFSYDRWRALKRGDEWPERGPTWGLTLVGIQLSSVYLWAAADKCNAAFISGDKLEQLLMYFQFGSDVPAVFGWQAMLIVMSVATIALEALLAVGLWVSRWHRWVLPLGCAFHALLYYLLQVDTFTVTVWAMYLTFIDPDRVHAAIDRLQRSAVPR